MSASRMKTLEPEPVPANDGIPFFRYMQAAHNTMYEVRLSWCHRCR